LRRYLDVVALVALRQSGPNRQANAQASTRPKGNAKRHVVKRDAWRNANGGAEDNTEYHAEAHMVDLLGRLAFGFRSRLFPHDSPGWQAVRVRT
jgi:hypothetical protein